MDQILYLSPLVHFINAFFAIALQCEFGCSVDDSVAIEPIVHHLVVVAYGSGALMLMAIHLGGGA